MRPTTKVASGMHAMLGETHSRRSRRHRKTRRPFASSARAFYKRNSHRADRRAARDDILTEINADLDATLDEAIGMTLERLLPTSAIDDMACVLVSTDGGRTFVPHYYSAGAFVYERDTPAIETIWGDDDFAHVDEDDFLEPELEEPDYVIPFEPLSFTGISTENALYAA